MVYVSIKLISDDIIPSTILTELVFTSILPNRSTLLNKTKKKNFKNSKNQNQISKMKCHLFMSQTCVCVLISNTTERLPTMHLFTVSDYVTLADA